MRKTFCNGKVVNASKNINDRKADDLDKEDIRHNSWISENKTYILDHQHGPVDLVSRSLTGFNGFTLAAESLGACFGGQKQPIS